MSKILGAITVAGTAFGAGSAVDFAAGASTNVSSDEAYEVEQTSVNGAQVIEMTDEELALAIEEYEEMYDKYYTLTEQTLSSIPTITEAVTLYDGIEYGYILNYSIDSIDFTVLYNDLGNTPTYGVGNLEGIVLVNDGVNEELVLTMSGALVQDYFDGDKLHIDATDLYGNSFEVTYKIDDSGIKYEYSYFVNDLEGNLNIKTKNKDSGSEFSIRVLEGEYTNSYKYTSKVEDGTENVKVEYTVEGISATVKVTSDEESTEYEFYDGISKGHHKGSHDNKGGRGDHHSKH